MMLVPAKQNAGRSKKSRAERWFQQIKKAVVAKKMTLFQQTTKGMVANNGNLDLVPAN